MAVHSVTDDTGQGGWQDTQPTEPIGTTTPCPQLGKRHKWKGGDVCTVCGATKADARTEAKPQREPSTERLSVRVGAFETLGATVWAALGLGVQYQPIAMNQPVKREDGTEV